MGDTHRSQSPFDIPDLPDWMPRRLKPWLFVLFVLTVQFSGGIYLAAATDMVGTTALMQEDVLMAGYASLVGMSINFCVMFRLKFRFSNRVSLLICAIMLIAANIICVHTASVPVLVGTCFLAGWFRMWATFACNSTIQLWITPGRDMAVFFCYVYIIVDSVIQLSGIATIYTAFFSRWEYMHWTMSGMLVVMLVLVLVFVKPVKGPIQIPLLGIDWIGAALWSVFMLCVTFICVYGGYYDWWEAPEIGGATVLAAACLAVNLWRASFLRHPYLSYQTLTNRNVVRATLVYIVFFTLLATEHVFEHSYAATVLRFDETNLIDLNWYVLAGIIAGCVFTYHTFARRRWRYKTMTAIGFALAAVYLAYFYFTIDYGVEKEALLVPLFARGFASVVISIIFLTSMTPGESKLHFFVFPQALTVNGFTGAVLGAALGPAIVGEMLRHTLARNAALVGAGFTATDTAAAAMPLAQSCGLVQVQALVVSMKEIYGWLLMTALLSLAIIVVSYSPVRPSAIFPKWRTIRKIFRRETALLLQRTLVIIATLFS